MSVRIPSTTFAGASLADAASAAREPGLPMHDLALVLALTDGVRSPDDGRVIDQELSAALRVYYQAWYDHFYDPDRRTPGAVVSTINERFIASVGSPRAEELLQEILLLQAEAAAVPDPGGPIGNYGRALDEWAATHPEIDPRSVHWITSRLLRAAM